MKENILEEFNDILKSLDDFSQDKIHLFTVKIVRLFKKIHANSEFGTAKEKKEAFEFVAQIQKSFNKLKGKLEKNSKIDSGQFKNLFDFIEKDVRDLEERRANSSIYIKKPAVKEHKKKKVIKKV